MVRKRYDASAFSRLRTGGLLLLTVFVVAVVGYKISGQYSWSEAFWFVVITISTVGYSEHSTFSPTLQIFTVFVILFGISASAYTFGGLVQMMLEGEIERLMGVRRMNRDIESLKDHTIVCGFGRMGRKLVEGLKDKHVAIVVLEKNGELLEQQTGLIGSIGDATEEKVLRRAGIERAKTLVTALPSDAENVFVTLTARNLNPDVFIIARAERESTEAKLKQAGASRVVLPTVVGARRMARMITHPLTADLIDLACEKEFANFGFDELTVRAQSPLASLSVGETEAHRKHKLLVAAILKQDEELVFNPDSEYRFQPGDMVITMGHADDISRFRKEYGID